MKSPHPTLCCDSWWTKPRLRPAGITENFGSGQGVSPLVGILVWSAAGVAVYAGWHAGDTTGPLVLIMLVVFVWGLAQALGGSFTLGTQTRLAANLLRCLESGQDVDGVLASPRLRRSLVRRVVRNVRLQGRFGAEQIDGSPLLDLLHGRLMEQNDRARAQARRLFTLGLIGTCVGLIAALNGMTKAAAAAGDAGGPAVMQALFSAGGPLTGMGTAIVTTLLGAFLGGVVLESVCAWNERAINRFVNSCEELLTVYIIPELRASALAASTPKEKGGSVHALYATNNTK